MCGRLVSLEDTMTPIKRAWIILIVLSVAEATPLAVFAALDGLRFVRSLGFGGAHPGTAIGWTLGILFGVLFAGFSASRSPFIAGHLLKLDAMKLFVLFVMAPVTGTFEELYFRKVLMNALAAHGWTVALQILVSALVFGAVHGIWGLFGKSVRIAIGATIATALLGALMAIAYIAAARSVAPCIVGHALVNAILEPWLILAATSRAWQGVRFRQA